MTIETNSNDGDRLNGSFAAIWRKARGRYSSRQPPHRRHQRLAYGLASINAVVIAFLVFDIPLGAAAKDLPIRLISVAAAITDVGRLVSLAAALSTILAASLVIFARKPDLRRRFRLTYLCRTASYLLASLLSASAIVNIAKYAIGRARPPLYEQYGVLGFDPFHGGYLFESFPSAHSANVGAVLAALAMQFPRFRLLFASVALWLAMTRVIVGAHYPSDVIAGLALGAWCAFAVAILFTRIGWIFMASPDGWPMPRLRRPMRRHAQS